MAMSRRRFVGLTLAGAGLAVLPRDAWGAWGRAVQPERALEPTYLDWKRPAERVRVAFGDGGNSMAVQTQEGVVLVDAKNAPFGPVLRREAESLAPVRLLINTHHHADHTGGNHAFTAHVQVLAHEKCPARVGAQVNRYISQVKEAVLTLSKSERPKVDEIRRDVKELHDRMGRLEPGDFRPTRTFGAGEEFEFGNERFVLRHFGPGHTDNDAVVFIAGRNVLHAGDLLFRRLHPFIDAEGGATTSGWIDSLRRAVELCDESTVVVPGHGEITDVDGLHEQIGYFEKLRCIVRHARDVEGMTRAEVMALQTGAFEGYGFEQLLARSLGAVYDEEDLDER